MVKGYTSDNIMCVVKIYSSTKAHRCYQKGKKYCKNIFEYEASILAILDHLQFSGMYYIGEFFSVAGHEAFTHFIGISH